MRRVLTEDLGRLGACTGMMDFSMKGRGAQHFTGFESRAAFLWHRCYGKMIKRVQDYGSIGPMTVHGLAVRAPGLHEPYFHRSNVKVVAANPALK